MRETLFVLSICVMLFGGSCLEMDHMFGRVDPDNALDFLGMCKHHGYEAEAHEVTTSDGYILTMHHIKGKKGESRTFDPKKVVYMQHGIIDCSDTFINNGPGLGPAYILSDAGFDVWLGNSRGSYYSMKHTHWDAEKDSEYWDFSFEEMGRYDITAEIEYVLKQTGVKKVSYVGHSQGTTQLFFALTEDQEWFKERVYSFTALGPACKVSHTKSSFLRLLAQSHAIKVLKYAGVTEMLPRNYNQAQAFGFICDITPELCSSAMYFISDSQACLNNQEKMQVFIAHYPSGTSLKGLQHFSQLLIQDRFAYFDYGAQQNLKKYGQSSPPNIDLSKIIDFPIALFVGKTDELATTTDANWIVKNLGDNSLKHYEEVPGGHLSFLLAEDMSYFENVVRFIEAQI